jgi:putative transposase
VYSWVLMTNHLHAILSSSKDDLSNIIRDFKKFTSTQIIEAIGRNRKQKQWMLWLLKQKSETDEDKKQLWQPGNHPIEIRTEKFYKQKMQYIHQNQIRAGWVRNEEDYECSSAGYFYKKPTAVNLSFYNG